MSKKLIIAEKPSVGRDIARVMNCTKKNGNMSIEGQKYIVTWALGHLVTLSRPEAYGQKYEKWSMETLPMLPDKLKLEIIPKTSRQFKAVNQLLHRKDITEIIIATDAGREGELVARWILEMSNIKKPIKRLWISSVTDKAIKEGFSNLKNGKDYQNLYMSAVARAEADWIVGLNGTRALTTKYNAQLSCGRVQTPTLAMINYREKEILGFIPKKYWQIDGIINGIKFNWIDSKTKNKRSFDENYISNIISKIKGKDGQITQLSKKVKKTYSKSLYDLTELQRDANNIYGFSAKETLKIMQKLYEQHKALTYPRTDSRFLTDDIVPTLKDRLSAVQYPAFRSAVQKIKMTPIVGNSRYVDNKKVSDHHAIIPTEQKIIIEKLDYKERKIYELVIERFLEVLMPAYEYEELEIVYSVEKELFKAKTNRTVSAGWKIIKSNDLNKEFDKNLENIDEKMHFILNSVKKREGQTKPPEHFNEASLLGAMENPKKYMETKDSKLIETIDNIGGLGTVATRADIIEKLFNTNLIEKRDQSIYMTSKGKQLLNLAPNSLRSPELTAKWEIKLNEIAQGQLDKNKFVDEMKEYTKTIIREIKNSKETYRHDNITRQKCPECGKFLLDVSNKNGKALICQDRDCGYRKQISRVTNARCPECHKKMNMVGDGEKKAFLCPKCGYREKLSSFEKRKKERGNQLSKKDVKSYLKKQNNEDDINNPFADLLKGFKL